MSTRRRIGLSALVILALAGAAETRDRADPPTPKATGPQEVEVMAVLIDQRTQQPTVLLQGKRDKRRLAMAIGHAEATGIAFPLNGVTPPRPLTHDLFLTLFGRLKVTLTRAVITDLRDDIYYATVYLTSGSAELTLDARPSDAIALAIRAKVPVLVEDRVFDKGGSPAPSRQQI
ncbi:MAG: bifunctional nuclease family protein [Candidatus Rokubacteria bacterium]|nr:bifunctional nuclease family protein [Candidatus Rokubacteria bacterium]